ncbi:S-layer homology domain-containing protein [Dehalobacterium formicoaceticum]|uniref:S-layer homology domain-containing protein n=1 Tax=Dehalobacterium formicoaceticum TaxID=51515 RepID=UPI000B7D318F|nr:S-layer homology domain-containing protein [Dehalobacterium formicoaceticum]
MKRKTLIVLTLILALIFPMTALAEDMPPIPSIYKGTVVDQDGKAVSAGTINAYTKDTLRGSIDLKDGKFSKFLVTGDVDTINIPVAFTIEINGVEADATADPEVKWQEGKISGLDIPEIKLTVDTSKLPDVSGQVSVEAANDNFTVKVGNTRQIRVTTTPDNAALSYQSDKTGVATVNSSGVVTAKGEGTAVITVTASSSGMLDGKATIRVRVSENPIEITVTPESVKLDAGKTQQLSVTTDPTGTTKSYKSSDTKVATVNSSGIITAVAQGTATITITAAKDNYEDGEDTVKVTVTSAGSGSTGNNPGTNPGTTPGTNPPGPTSFSDVPQNHWAYGNIALLAKSGIVGGYVDGTFQPAKNVTRAEFTKMLAIAVGLAEEKPAQPKFSDVPGTLWSYGFIEAAAKAGLVTGDAAGTFRPNDNITRQEMAAILVRAMGKIDAGTTNASLATAFTDDKSIAPWARGFVVSAVQDGLVGGYSVDNTFRPAQNATRAESCAMIARLLEKI